MTVEGLGFVNSIMEHLSIPYEFMEWTSEVPDTYWVGEYTEVEPMNEDGMIESDFLLIGTTNQKYLELESVKQELMEYLTTEGITSILDSGSGIMVAYSNSYPVPSVDEGVHRLQITLKIKEWKVNT